MNADHVQTMADRAIASSKALKESLFRYILSSGLAGAYVGLGIILIFSVGAPLFAAQSPVTGLVMGVSFGVALTLVIFAGSELFTGNNMFFTVSTLSGKTTWRETLYNWVVTYGGNLLGALVLCLLVIGAGLFKGIPQDHLLFTIAAKKMNLTFAEAFFRGILCNWFVCLAIWTASKVKSEPAKLILIWWMLFGFIASGYEHSIANMTVLSLAWLIPHPETITLTGWVHNMIPVTLGNIVGGGLFVGAIYWLINPIKREKKKAEQAVVIPADHTVYGK